MPGEAFRPEDILVTPDPDNPLAFRIQAVLREGLDPALVEFLQANNLAVSPEVQVTPVPAETHYVPPKSAVKEARLGPVEIRIDLAPIMKVVDRAFSGFQHVVEKLGGSDFAQLVEEIADHRRKPETDFENMIARILLGPTRFDRINDRED